MELCSEGHEEVCYEGRKCPACAIKEDLEEQLQNVQEDLKNAEAEIDTLLEERES